jgi:hypothetical protein
MAHLESRADYFGLFDRHRLRPDSWLKIEMLHVVGEAASQGLVREVRPDRQGCDLWFSAGGVEYWVVTKGLITSYAGGAREARQTVVSMEEVSRDLDKLRGLATLSGGNPVMLFAAFPFGPEPRENDEWRAQLLRFEAKGFDLVRKKAFALRQDRECRVYLFV